MAQMLAAYPKEMADEIRSINEEVFGGGKLERAMLDMMVKHYTEAEIVQLARFLASPVGQSSLQKQQIIMGEMAALGRREFLRVSLKRHPELAADADQLQGGTADDANALPPLAQQPDQLPAGDADSPKPPCYAEPWWNERDPLRKLLLGALNTMSDRPVVSDASLFSFFPADHAYPSKDDPYQAHLIEQYKVYVATADKISDRRQAANSYFLAVNSALLAFVGYAIPRDDSAYLWLVGFAGMSLSYLWYRIVRSHRDLNSAKFLVIQAIRKAPSAASIRGGMGGHRRRQESQAVQTCHARRSRCALDILRPALGCRSADSALAHTSRAPLIGSFRINLPVPVFSFWQGITTLRNGLFGNNSPLASLLKDVSDKLLNMAR